jgi:hypothetical protein
VTSIATLERDVPRILLFASRNSKQKDDARIASGDLLFTWLSRYCVQKATSKSKERRKEWLQHGCDKPQKEEFFPTPQQAPNTTTAPRSSEIETLTPFNRMASYWAASSSHDAASAQIMDRVIVQLD